MSTFDTNQLVFELGVQQQDEYEAWRHYNWLANQAKSLGQIEVMQGLMIIANQEREHARKLEGMLQRLRVRPTHKQLFVPSDEQTGMPDSNEEWERLGNKIIESDPSHEPNIRSAIDAIRQDPYSANGAEMKRYLVGYATRFGIISY